MKIYRDLFNSNPTVTFDAEAKIGIYLATPNQYTFYGNDGNEQLVFAPLSKQQRVNPPPLPCLEPPSNIGVEQADYVWDAVLADTNYGYVITYQRCCRNRTIANIESPGTIGSTYSVEITPEALHTNNSSPIFKSFPPIFICVGEPLVFDHSASDVDGNTVIYSFCSPFIGASDGNPIPDRPLPPPYTPVDFLLPTYSYNRPLISNPIIKINAYTGRMTGTPTILGQYVVSVCIEEYKDGLLLTKMFRDFQFNVVSCRRTIAAIVEADSVSGKQFFLHSCDLSAKLSNKSIERANIFNHVWQFNENGDTLRYTDWDPSVQFRKEGVYKGQLILNPNTVCSDTAILNIAISRGIKSDFSVKYDTCVAGEVNFTNKTILGSFPLKEIVWDYSDGKRDTNKLNPAHLYDNPGLKAVKLFVKDKYSCQKDTTIRFSWLPVPPIIIIEPDKFVGCTPAKVFFNNKSKPIDSTYNITWDFGDGGTSRMISPTHTFQNGGNYTVNLKIISPTGCYKEATFSNWIKIRTTTKADFDFAPERVTNLTPSVSFADKSIIPAVWHWNFNQKGFSTLQNPIYAFTDTGIHLVKLIMRNQNGCLDSISKNIYVEPEVTFFMPNAFSPNFDSTNDEFKGTGFIYGLKSFRLMVWNRWGSKIFETTNPNTGWNGQINNVGESVPEGVYLYEVQYTTPKDKKVVKRDFVTLIR
jgi:gliding motility-associated-like protein